MNEFEKLEALVAEARTDASAFYEKGNKAAGTRLRVKLKGIKTQANEIRANVTDIKKADKE